MPPKPPPPLNAAVRAGVALAILAASAACHRPASNPAPAGAPPASPPPRQVTAATPGAAPTALPDFEVNAVSTREGKAVWYDVPDGSLAQRRAWPDEMTAASDKLPPNTYVRVTRIENGKSVIVRITDHGLHKPSAIIDLDRTAAAALGMLKAGETQVKVEVLALKNANAAGPSPRETTETSPPKEPGASAADEKAAAERKPDGGTKP
jgi:rare lipoprotein A (peptidoglycan hydrolase)